MLSRPTTEQILLDCRHELLNTIDPVVSDQPIKIVIQMLENVLRNCAERSAHEIAWMHQESDLMINFSRDVHSTLGRSPTLQEVLRLYEVGHSASLHLDDVCATYNLAGNCFSVALEEVFAANHNELHRRGREILQMRLDNENTIKGEWSFVGRS